MSKRDFKVGIKGREEFFDELEELAGRIDRGSGQEKSGQSDSNTDSNLLHRFRICLFTGNVARIV